MGLFSFLDPVVKETKKAAGGLFHFLTDEDSPVRGTVEAVGGGLVDTFAGGTQRLVQTADLIPKVIGINDEYTKGKISKQEALDRLQSEYDQSYIKADTSSGHLQTDLDDGNVGNFVKKITGAGAQVASEVAPFFRGTTAAATGGAKFLSSTVDDAGRIVEPFLKTAAKEGIGYGLVGSGGNELLSEDGFDPGRFITNAAAGTLLSTAASSAGFGAGKIFRKGATTLDELGQEGRVGLPSRKGDESIDDFIERRSREYLTDNAASNEANSLWKKVRDAGGIAPHANGDLAEEMAGIPKALKNKAGRTADELASDLGFPDENTFIQALKDAKPNQKLTKKAARELAETEAKGLNFGDDTPPVIEQTLYRGSKGKVTPEDRVYKSTLVVPENQNQLLQELANQGDETARSLIGPNGRPTDYRAADKYLQQKFGDEFDSIQYLNENRPKDYGFEVHDLKNGNFYAENEVVARQYARQQRAPQVGAATSTADEAIERITRPVEGTPQRLDIGPGNPDLPGAPINNITEAPATTRARALVDSITPNREPEFSRGTQVKADLQVENKANKIKLPGEVELDVSGIKDIGHLQAGFRDVYRNMKTVFGENYGKVKAAVLDPFDKAKDRFITQQQTLTRELKENIVDKFGIKKGSPESAAIQNFGEGTIDLDQLKAQFPEKWEDIVNADKWFRDKYDDLLTQVNNARRKIYPNDPDKIIPRRDDYYRHFREIQGTIGSLKNLFDQPSGIASSLAGASDFTQPTSKFAGFMQRRKGGPTDVDAVGGFLDYVRAASYSINIDPEIGNFRNLAKQLASATENSADNAKVNVAIEFLNDFANDLAGKTPPITRAIQKYIPGGRTTMRALDWLNNRVKANVILGNASSTLAQLFNIPQGIADAGPKNAVIGAKETLKDIFRPNAAMAQSTFLKERFADTMYSQFDTKILEKTRNAAAWLTKVGDEIGSKYIWNMEYQKALAEKVADPIKFADDATRNMVAGRGVGEVPLVQKDKVFQLVAPFQLEVGNLWHVMNDWVDEKTFGKIATFAAASFIMNRAVEQIRGSDVSFDPINAIGEAAQAFMEEDDKLIGSLRAGGRLAGEVLSNVPGGQTAAALYPEQGLQFGDQRLTREELFGDKDPTRFGSGLLAFDAVTDPLWNLVTPFAGKQIQRTVKGATDLSKGYSETSTGRVRFGIEGGAGDAASALLFGPYATGGGKEYIKSGASALGDTQSELYKSLDSSERADLYRSIIEGREVKASIKKKIDKAKKKAKDAKKTPTKTGGSRSSLLE